MWSKGRGGVVRSTGEGRCGVCFFFGGGGHCKCYPSVLSGFMFITVSVSGSFIVGACCSVLLQLCSPAFFIAGSLRAPKAKQSRQSGIVSECTFLRFLALSYLYFFAPFLVWCSLNFTAAFRFSGLHRQAVGSAQWTLRAHLSGPHRLGPRCRVCLRRAPRGHGQWGCYTEAVGRRHRR